MPKLLSASQVEAYARDGFVSPVDVLSSDEVKRFRQELQDWEKDRGQAIDFPEKSKSYLLFNWADQLVHHPRILDAVEDVIGPDILVYHSTLFLKEANTPAYVRWHQDSTYWPLSPTKTVTVWLAIDDADPENANMKFIPRSHLHGLIDYDETDDVDTVLDLAVKNPTSYGDAEVDVTLQAGQFSMHSDLLLHGSEANESERRRCGLTIGYAAADVTTWYDWHNKGFVVRGNNVGGHWANPTKPDH